MWERGSDTLAGHPRPPERCWLPVQVREASQGLDGLCPLFLWQSCPQPHGGQAFRTPCARLRAPDSLGVLPGLPLGAVPQLLRQTQAVVLRQNWAWSAGPRRGGVSPQLLPQQPPTQGTGSVRGHTPWTTQGVFRAPLSPSALRASLLQISSWSPALLLESPRPLVPDRFPPYRQASCVPSPWFPMQSASFSDLHCCLWEASAVNMG